MRAIRTFFVRLVETRLGVVVFVVSFVFAGFFWQKHAAPLQPIAFNHKVHVAAGLNCVDCHAGAQEQAQATLPSIATCMGCHEAALTPSPEEAKIRTIASAGGELHWAKITRVAPHVFFSHRRHVHLAGLQCADCHGDMQDAATPPTRRYRPLDMNDCLRCHQQRGLKSDCNDCHR